VLEYLQLFVEIVWVDIVLSGDNAVVIALACRHLPESQRQRAVMLGTCGAVAARISLLFVVSAVLSVPFVHVIGGAFLFWVAVKLWRDKPEFGDADPSNSASSIWQAVMIVVAADVVMSIDNVVSVAAIAKDSKSLLAIGTLLSIPIMIYASFWISRVITKLPILGKASAVFLGFVAGQTMAAESFINLGDELEFVIAVVSAIGVAFVGLDGYATRDEGVQT
jgi:YjbE family integral membrane protein